MFFDTENGGGGKKNKSGTFAFPNQHSSRTIECGFKPSVVVIYKEGTFFTNFINMSCVYIGGRTFLLSMTDTGSSGSHHAYNNATITPTDNGFTIYQSMTAAGAGATVNYFALE